MADSDEEQEQKRRDRDKFKRERESLGDDESGVKRRNVIDYDSKWKAKRDYSPTNRSLIKRIKRDLRDPRSFNIPWHPWDVQMQEYCQNANDAKLLPLNEPTAFTLLTFKQFMMDQDDLIDEIESVKKYSDYKQSINAHLISSFFDKHKDQQWFQEKYHPLVKSLFSDQIRSVFLQRFVSFWLLFDKGLIEVISLDSDNTCKIQNILKKSIILMEDGSFSEHSIAQVFIEDNHANNNIAKSSADQVMHQNPDTTCVLHSENVEVTEESNFHTLDGIVAEPVLEQVKPIREQDYIFPRSIFVKSYPLSIKREHIEEACSSFDNLIRIFLSDPIKNLTRNGWLTFASNVDMKSVVSHLESSFGKSKFDSDISYSIVDNKQPEIRSVDGCHNALDVIISDLSLAIKLVKEFDEKNSIFSSEFQITDVFKQLGVEGELRLLSKVDVNPLLKNIPSSGDLTILRKNLAAAEKAEEEEEGVIPSEVCYRRDHGLMKILDTLILYLRIVYSFDFYSFNEIRIEDLMPCRISHLTVRGNINNSATLQDVNGLILNHNHSFDSINRRIFISDSEMSQLGKRNEKDSIEKFISENTKMLDPEKYLCPLSGKKFKGPEYVRKHIYNKHNDKIQEVKLEVQYFNNYLADSKRPMMEIDLSLRKNYSHTPQNQANNSDKKLLPFDPSNNSRSKETITPVQNWPFQPNFILPPHGPPLPPPFEYNRYSSFGHLTNRRSFSRKIDDTRKPISYKDWDDPNLDT